MTTSTVRIGLIGAGRWGKHYISTLLSLGPRCRLTHVATSKPANAALVPYPVEVVADWRKMLESDCEAVIIATPAPTHAAIVEACLEAGKPCMVEKPFCLDVTTAERLHRLAQATATPVLVDHLQLFNPAYQALKRAIHGGQERMHLLLSEGMALGPFRTQAPTVWEWCPHDVSLCVDLIGQLPARVSALGGPADSQGAPELISLRLDFPSGVCAWIQAGRLVLQKRRNLSVFTDRHLYLFDDTAVEKLTVSPFCLTDREATVGPCVLEKRGVPIASERRPLANAVSYFLDGLQGGDRHYFGTAFALEVTRVLAQCETALQEGGAVRPAVMV